MSGTGSDLSGISPEATVITAPAGAQSPATQRELLGVDFLKSDCEARESSGCVSMETEAWPGSCQVIVITVFFSVLS